VVSGESGAALPELHTTLAKENAMRLLPALFLGLLVAGPARAGDPAVSLKPPSGKPGAGAVVMVAAAVKHGGD
jgi:hypothetical protein